MTKTVLVVDDSVPVRRTIRNLFNATDGFEVCGEASDGREGIEKAEELHPDLIIMNLSMPGMNGIDAARILHRILPSVPLILFSGHSAVFREEEAHSVGIPAEVSKDESIGTLLGRARRLVHAD